eukprot:TRINITY_DN3983_c0_g1_i3.p1 TRINITY_DN3983_c0_g1~~TRINITY_DN3983_c0_g1_i3.p1  ORF type:complete len:248 (+),score=29.27 TRINITY_DN3983_c0_g1_i3:76-744(+)
MNGTKNGRNQNNMLQRVSKSIRNNQGILVVVALLMVTILASLYLFSGQSEGLNQSESNRFQMGADSLCQEQSKPYTIVDSIADMKRIFQARVTDKGKAHGYYRTYGRLFHSYKNDPIRLLEIGVQTGRSMGAWQDYFPNYQHVYGIGYGAGFAKQEKKKEVEGKRITLYDGDQSDIEFLNYVCDDAGAPLDIIIDDGSHVPDHQQISLEVNFCAFSVNYKIP